jgi:hypothetical protein
MLVYRFDVIGNLKNFAKFFFELKRASVAVCGAETAPVSVAVLTVW